MNRLAVKEHQLKLIREEGVALPAALFLVLTMAMVSALTARVSQMNLRQIVQSEAAQDTFQTSEGGGHDIFRQMAASPELWRELDPLEDQPSGYVEYNPANFTSTNGIPVCSGIGCHRNRYPIGGGLVKNFGPLSGDGALVETAYSVIDQLDPDDPPQADTVLNGNDVWVQVERLEEIAADVGSLGGGLENNKSSGSRAGLVRFRVTATSFRDVRSETGRSTVVFVVELAGT